MAYVYHSISFHFNLVCIYTHFIIKMFITSGLCSVTVQEVSMTTMMYFLGVESNENYDSRIK